MEEERDVGTRVTTENNYEELSKTDKDLQSYVDRRVSDALKTAKIKWQKNLEVEKVKVERLAKKKSDKKFQNQLEKERNQKGNVLEELNAYKLREQALIIASQKGLDVSLLNLIDFKNITAEQLSTNIDNMISIFNKAVERVINEKLKEYMFITPVTSTVVNKIIVKTSY